jgi:hypothetical protein
MPETNGARCIFLSTLEKVRLATWLQYTGKPPSWTEERYQALSDAVADAISLRELATLYNTHYHSLDIIRGITKIPEV